MTAKLLIVGMQNFQDTFQTRKRSVISALSICMTVPLTTFFDEITNIDFTG